MIYWPLGDGPHRNLLRAGPAIMTWMAGQKDRAAAIAGRSRRQAATATWVAEMARRKDTDAAADDGVELDDKEKERAERYSRGRGGTSLGSAVHGALQDLVTELQSGGKLPLDDSVDMAQEVVGGLNGDISRLAKHHAAENDIGGREGEIRPLVEQALQHKAVVKALRAPERAVAGNIGSRPAGRQPVPGGAGRHHRPALPG